MGSDVPKEIREKFWAPGPPDLRPRLGSQTSDLSPNLAPRDRAAVLNSKIKTGI
jgi:hypothetical protein